MGSGKFKPDFSLVLEEFVRGLFVLFGPKMEFGSFFRNRIIRLGQRMTQNGSKIVFEGPVNTANGQCASLRARA